MPWGLLLPAAVFASAPVTGGLGLLFFLTFRRSLPDGERAGTPCGMRGLWRLCPYLVGIGSDTSAAA